jgi:aspartyl-tRNA(Asn)/glutamyl-tRNA(Gln) amidotransferase subunit A
MVCGLRSSLDQVGVFGASVDDVATVLGVIAGRDLRDSTTADVPVPDYRAALTGDVKGARIGFPKSLFGEGLDEEVRSSVAAVVETYRELGAGIVPVELPRAKYAIAVYYIIATAEASSNLARFDGVRYGFRAEEANELRSMYRRTREEGFGPEVKRRIMLGTYVLSAGYYDAYYRKAQQVRTLLKADFERAFEVATPSLRPRLPRRHS